MPKTKKKRSPTPTSPTSPTKARLLQQSQALPPLEDKEYPLIASSGQSRVYAKGHRHVLLVTSYKIAKKIELLRTKLSSDAVVASLIEIPKLVAAAGSVVYEMTRYDDTLEEIKTLRYKEDSIVELERYLTDAVTLLHNNNLTHNDISLKNIMYSGEYPHLKFHLIDFGSLTENTPKQHQKKTTNDFIRIYRVVDKLREVFNKKYNGSLSKPELNRHFLPSYIDKKRAKLGMSPLKPAASLHTRLSTVSSALEGVVDQTTAISSPAAVVSPSRIPRKLF